MRKLCFRYSSQESVNDNNSDIEMQLGVHVEPEERKAERKHRDSVQIEVQPVSGSEAEAETSLSLSLRLSLSEGKEQPDQIKAELAQRLLPVSPSTFSSSAGMPSNSELMLMEETSQL